MKALAQAVIFICVFLASLPAAALTIYEIRYEFRGLTEFPTYTAMLVRYGNGTGFMRVRYTNKAKTEVYVVNMEFDEVEGRSKIDGMPHLTLQFRGKNPKYIMNTSGKKENEAYNPDVLWFKKEANDKNFRPWGVTSRNEDGTYEQGTIGTVKVMNVEDLTQSYVKTYFLDSEPFYKNLFKKNPVAVNPTGPGNNGSTNPSPSTTPTKIHLVVVAATEDPRIGFSVQKDVINFSSQIKDVATFLSLPLNYVEVSGKNFGKANLEAAVNNLRPQANDIVIFYYSGHGYSAEQNPREQYPQFDLRQSRFDDILKATVNASEILNRIQSKNARLNLVFTDCCNSNLGLLKPEGKNFALTTKSLLDWEKSFVYDLFMKSKGSILATAAKKGQYAYGNTDVGGYFTSNLITSIEKYLSKFQTVSPSWQQIITEAQSSTVKLSLSNTCAPNVTCRQDPIYAVDLR